MNAQPVVAVTASEFTAPCVAFARTRLLAAGYAVTVFDAAGPAFERFVRAGHAAGQPGGRGLPGRDAADPTLQYHRPLLDCACIMAGWVAGSTVC